MPKPQKKSKNAQAQLTPHSFHKQENSHRSPRRRKKQNNYSFALGLSLAIFGTAFLVLFNLNGLNQSSVQIAQASEFNTSVLEYTVINPHPNIGKVDFVYDGQVDTLDYTLYYLSADSCDTIRDANLTFSPTGQNSLTILTGAPQADCNIQDSVLVRNFSVSALLTDQADLEQRANSLNIIVE